MTDTLPPQRRLLRNFLSLLDHEDAVEPVDENRFRVLQLRGFRRALVKRDGDQWRCNVDKKNTQDNPCSHILVARYYVGEIAFQNTANEVWSKGREKRRHGVEHQAWKRVPTRAPAILATLLRQALPHIAPTPPVEMVPRGGRPTAPLLAKCYQAILRAGIERRSLRTMTGAMPFYALHAEAVSEATISRFLAQAETEAILEKLLLLTLWPVRRLETLVHPDGTGLTEQHFGAYFDERYAKDRAKRDERRKARVDKAESALAVAAAEAVYGPKKPLREETPRKHHWTFAEILWTYRYTMIAAIHSQPAPFGEAPWLIPLLERARLVLDVAEVGGDKAYDSNPIYRYAADNGIEAQIKFRDTGLPTRSSHAKRYRKLHMVAGLVDPQGFAARANRRNNAETGNHAFKAICGDQVFSKKPEAQRSEVLCMAIAYNLTRLVFFEVEHGQEVDFRDGAERIAWQAWESLAELRQRTEASGYRAK